MKCEKMTEAQVTTQIRALLNAFQIFHFKHWSGMMTGTKGIADILACRNGKFIAIEVKKSDWKPPKKGTKAYKHFRNQYLFLERVRNAGGIGFFARSTDDVIEKLNLKIGNGGMKI